MTNHLRRWGAAWILLMLFIASWSMQAVAQFFWEQEDSGKFWAATFENWQSEWLQLLVQAVVVVGFAEKLFRKSTEQMDRIEHKIDEMRK